MYSKNKLHFLEISLHLKSVHFKKTVAQSSFLSKVFSFLLKSKQSQWKVQHFWKKWGFCNCLLKMNGLYEMYLIYIGSQLSNITFKKSVGLGPHNLKRNPIVEFVPHFGPQLCGAACPPRTGSGKRFFFRRSDFLQKHRVMNFHIL